MKNKHVYEAPWIKLEHLLGRADVLLLSSSSDDTMIINGYDLGENPWE